MTRHIAKGSNRNAVLEVHLTILPTPSLSFPDAFFPPKSKTSPWTSALDLQAWSAPNCPHGTLTLTKQTLGWPHVPVHGTTHRLSGELCPIQQTPYIHVTSRQAVSILLQGGAEACRWEVFFTASSQFTWQLDICQQATFPKTRCCSSSPLCLFPGSILYTGGVDRPGDAHRVVRRNREGEEERAEKAAGEERRGKKGQEKAELPCTHK